MRGIVSAGSDTSASSRGMPIRTAAPRGGSRGRPRASPPAARSPRSRRRPRRRSPPGLPRRSPPACPPGNPGRCAKVLRRPRASPTIASTATTGSAPTATAPMKAESPTPPHPITATRSPGRTPAVRQTAPTPVVTAQPTRACDLEGHVAGIGTQQRSGTTQRLGERREERVVEDGLAVTGEPRRAVQQPSRSHRRPRGRAEPRQVAQALRAARTTAPTRAPRGRRRVRA